MLCSSGLYRIIQYMLVALAALALSTCSAALPDSSEQIDLSGQVYDLPASGVIRIAVERGRIHVTGGSSRTVDLDGYVRRSPRITFEVLPTPDELLIAADIKGSSRQAADDALIDLTVRVPENADVLVETFGGIVELSGLRGTVRVESISSDVLASDLQGTIWLKTGRGDVTIASSEGDIHVLGEHGALSVVDCTGSITVTTIMGPIAFEGVLGPEDIVRLESDHAAVDVRLGAGSDVRIAMQTVNGRVLCTYPGLTGSMSGCSGTLADGRGSLDIRTVTGDITIGAAP